MTKVTSSLLRLGATGAAIATLGWAAPSYALAVLGNELLNSGNQLRSSSSVNDTVQKGVAFTTDSRAWNLDSVTLTLTGLDDLDSPRIEIRADNAGDPGAALATLGNPNPVPDDLGDIANFTFTPTSSFTFNPFTTYWLVVAANTSSTYNLVRLQRTDASPIPETPTSSQGWSFLRYERSTNSGATWATSALPNAFQIDATEVQGIPFGFTPIPGLLLTGGTWGVKRLRNRLKSSKILGASAQS